MHLHLSARIPVMITLLLAVVLSLTCGCHRTGGVTTGMNTAESIMETAPDSALSILRTIDSSKIPSEGEKAHFALLMSQALDKNYIDVTDDSLIKRAHDYYAHGNDRFRSMLSKYYYARVLYNAQRYDESIVLTLEALDLNESTDYLWDARIVELMADIYHQCFLYDLEIAKIKRAISSFRKSGRPRNVAFSRCDLAVVMYANDDYLPALALMDSVRAEATISDDSILLAHSLSGLMKINNALGRFSDAKNNFLRLKQLENILPLSHRDCFEAGIATLNLDNPDEAINFLSMARKLETGSTDKYLSVLLEKEICQATGDFERAAALGDTLLAFQNRSNHEILNQPVTLAQQKYLSAKRQESENAVAIMKDRIVFAVGLLALALFFAFAIIRRRIRRMTNELDSKIEDISSLTEELDAKENQILTDKKRIDELCAVSDEMYKEKECLSNIVTEQQQSELMAVQLCKRQLSTLDSICRRYYSEEQSELNYKILHKEIISELKKLRDDKTLDTIVHIANLRKGNIVDRICSEMPDLGADDRRFLGLLYAGFSVKSIAFILQMKVKGVYSKRRRLFEKIRANTQIDPNE